MAKLNEKKKPVEQPFHFNIKKTISVDSDILNFGSFYPEKLLGSNLLIQNLTNTEQVIELTIDAKTQIYDTERICNSHPEFKYLGDLIEEQEKKLEKEEP